MVICGGHWAGRKPLGSWCHPTLPRHRRSLLLHAPSLHDSDGVPASLPRAWRPGPMNTFSAAGASDLFQGSLRRSDVRRWLEAPWLPRPGPHLAPHPAEPTAVALRVPGWCSETSKPGDVGGNLQTPGTQRNQHFPLGCGIQERFSVSGSARWASARRASCAGTRCSDAAPAYPLRAAWTVVSSGLAGEGAPGEQELWAGPRRCWRRPPASALLHLPGCARNERSLAPTISNPQL